MTSQPDMFERIERAVAEIAAGRPVVVVDDEDRENEGDLIFAAEKATPELMSFMVRFTSGYMRTALGSKAKAFTRLPLCVSPRPPR